MSQSSTKIYIAYHKASTIIKSKYFFPIHVGRSKSKEKLNGIIGDDTGDNISKLNNQYCEITALYWAWKNATNSTYVGLMHYRRLFDFSDKYKNRPTENFIPLIDVNTYIASSSKWITENIKKFDIITPKVHKSELTIYNNYCKTHQENHWYIVERYIEGKYPDYLETFHEVARGKSIYLANMFIMKKKLFNDYMSWLFDILENLRNSATDKGNLSAYEYRYLGFMAERLFTIYVKKLKKDNKRIKHLSLHILNLSKSCVLPYDNLGRFCNKKDVNIAFSSDENYVSHAAAMIRSICDCSSIKRTYNLFFLCSNVSKRSIELLHSMLFPFKNINLYTILVGDLFVKSYRSKTRSPSNATYNRFLLFKLLPHINRLLYLDVDMIILKDVAKIFDEDIKNAWIGAVPDYIMTRSIKKNISTKDYKVKSLYHYQAESLGLNNYQILRYFNAGVLLFNFSKFDAEKVGNDLINMAKEKKYLFRDQDILNSYFKKKYFVLPAEYNVFNSNQEAYFNVPKNNQDIALKAKKNPYIIHYASKGFKPWEEKSCIFSEYYWSSLIKTPFYAKVIEKKVSNIFNRSTFKFYKKIKRVTVIYGIKIADKYPFLRPFLLKIHTFLYK